MNLMRFGDMLKMMGGISAEEKVAINEKLNKIKK